MVITPQVRAEIINMDRERLDVDRRREAFNACDHGHRCFIHCYKKHECVNRGVINRMWLELAEKN